MKVAMYYNNHDVRLEEMEKPKIKDGELLVKVKASGICGSDVMEWYRIKRAPLVLGHEISGQIIDVGIGEEKYKAGDRVFVSHHVPCEECHFCLQGHQTACETLHKTNYFPGGFAEYIRIPKINVKKGVYLLPNEMSYEEGTLIEPLACAVRGQRIAKINKNCSVLIIGSGVSGLLHLQLAKAKGASPIFATDIKEFRLSKANEFGADLAITANEEIVPKIKAANAGRLVDRVIVCAGSLKAAKQAIYSVERGGIILFFAVPEPGKDPTIPLNDFWRKEITLATSYGAAPIDLKESLKLLKSKTIDAKKMITHRFSLDQAGKGFKIAAEADKCLKVVLIP